MNILVVKPSSAAFDSLSFFTNTMINAFKDLGHHVYYANDIHEMFQYKDQCDFLFMFHANSALEVNGRLLFEQFQIPIVNFIVDHPHLHHIFLNVKLPNYYVVCLDSDHIPYIQTYYPHIVETTTGWLSAGISHSIKEYSEKDHSVLMIGSYSNENEILHNLDEFDPFIQEISYDALDVLMEHSETPVETALMHALSNRGIVLTPDSFCQLNASAGCVLDYYLRAFYRHLIVVSLLQANIPLTLCGIGWESMPGMTSNCNILPSVPFAQSAAVIANSKLVLNINPWFQNGAHDRVFTTLLNQSVCISNTNAYQREHFTSSEIINYSLNDTDSLIDSIHYLLGHEEESKLIAENGYRKMQKDYDVHCLAQNILQMVSSKLHK